MIKLYEVQQVGNKYCGPAVISSLTGIQTNHAAALIRKVNPNRLRVANTSCGDLYMALNLLGFKMSSHHAGLKLGTLKNWAKQWAIHGETYIVSVGHHWVILQGRNQTICGLTKKMVHIDDHPKWRSQVKEVFKVIQSEKIDPHQVIEEHKPVVKPKRTGATARRRAKLLMTEYGLDYDEFDSHDPDDGTVMIYPPSSLYPDERDDPHDGDHCNYGWNEALVMINEYISIIKAKKA
jgi:hypothetical protein